MKFIRSVSLMTVFVMVVLSFPAFAAGAETEGVQKVPPSSAASDKAASERENQIQKIVSFDPLPSAIAFQSGTVKSNPPLNLPEALAVQITEGGQTKKANVPVSWTASPAYNSDRAGDYIFTAQLPANYTADTGCAPPKIRMTIKKQSSSVSGLSINPSKKARSQLSDKVTISPAYGRSVQLQMKVNGQWVTKRSYTLSNSKSAALTISYTNDWWKTEKSSWRLTMGESGEGTGYTSPTVTVSTQRYYQTPGKYFKVKNFIPTRKSGYTLKRGMSGYKVYKVQKKLKCYSGRAKYTSATAARVKQFQRKKGLKATGKVNKATWLKMGFKEKDWYYLDSYVTPVKVNPASTKADHINAMVNTAKSYIGTKYVWCASAKRKQGVDCAGLVIQCLYAAGIDPLPQGSHVYAYSKNEYTTRKLWANKKFKHVKYRNKKKGDIIVYHNGRGTVNHVSLYIGGGMEIESLPGPVKYSRAGGHVKGVLRPII